MTDIDDMYRGPGYYEPDSRLVDPKLEKKPFLSDTS